jgi:parallel beta-helix repeat protein
MKTLDQIEPRTPISALPFTISAPGSYFITGNLTGVAGQHGITINADHVTLDLGGFELVGPGGAVTAGIRVINAHVNATIRNGTVRGWLSSSVVAETSTCMEMHVENVRVFNGGSAGILLGNNGTAKACEVRGCVAFGISGGTSCKVLECTAVGQTGPGGDGINVGADSIVTDCVANGNGSDGIQVGSASRISGCAASGNTTNGLNVAPRSTVRDCSADSNGAAGLTAIGSVSVMNSNASGNGTHGFTLSSGCTLSNCSATTNVTHGFNLGSGSALSNCSAAGNSNGFNTGDAAALENCSALSNTGIGINTGDGGSILNCVAELNQGTAGIQVSNACTVIGCTLRDNTSSAATSAGISTGTECLVSRCVVSNTNSTAAAFTASTGMGINVNSTGSCTIEHCTVQGSRGDGIRVSAACFVFDNTSDRNGLAGDGAGVHSTSSENRIERNSVTGNDRGIDVDSSGSLIIKNSAATNTIDYEIAASNRYGAIINITAAGAAAVSGNSAASTLTSTDPWANFSY